MASGKILISLDLGYASVGWTAAEWAKATIDGVESRVPRVLGSGTVVFESNRCLAMERRAFRRQRRHIRATRKRIARMKAFLLDKGVITAEIAERRHLSFEPWRLAAEALHGRKLTAEELWAVLLWYAHNRGYDGNRLWSGKLSQATETDKEDTKKVEAAKSEMEKEGSASMAETVLKIVTGGQTEEAPVNSYRKKGMAFPRRVVTEEVRRILEAHAGVLPGLDQGVVMSLMADPLKEPDALRNVPGIPKAYVGGYLFGQIKPRFDNRIISTCPISGLKVPGKATDAFLAFRWAALLSRVRVDIEGYGLMRGLTSEEMTELDAYVQEHGRYTGIDFKKAVRKMTGCRRDNLDALFNVPDQDTALTRYPGRAALDRWGRGEDVFRKDEETQRKLRVISHALFQGKTVTQGELVPLLVEGHKVKIEPDKEIGAPLPSGRAPYAAKVMREAAEAIFRGEDPWATGGVLYRDATEEDPLPEEDIDRETNNHLVRHRVKILLRLLRDIIKKYAENNPSRVEKLFLEVARDIKDFSGKNQKQISSELAAIRRSHEQSAKRAAKDLGVSVEAINAGLIRKLRIAADMNFTCPYTGRLFDVEQIRNRTVDLDHILPRSQRQTDALDALTLTFNTINKLKSNRTALEFIREFGGQTVKIHSAAGLDEVAQIRYEDEFVRTMKAFRPKDFARRPKQEQRVIRERQRKFLMLKAKEEEGMTAGMLTQTSAVMKLACRAVKGWFQGRGCDSVRIEHIPGRITKEIRSHYRLLDILAESDTRLLRTYIGLDGERHTDTVPKGDMRRLTHMHHAADAVGILLAGMLMPTDGRVWSLMAKRHHSEDERAFLAASGPFIWSVRGEMSMKPLPLLTEQSIRQALGELRVVCYVSKRIGRTVLETTQWHVERTENGRVFLRQGTRFEEMAEGAVYGLHPKAGKGKLKNAEAVYVADSNYAIALSNPPTMIRNRFVWQQLQAIKARNGGTVRLLRKGDLIRATRDGKTAIWMVRSIKDNKDGLCVDLTYPQDAENAENKVGYSWVNRAVVSLLKDPTFAVIESDLTGVPACPITQSKSADTKKRKSAAETDSSSAE